MKESIHTLPSKPPLFQRQQTLKSGSVKALQTRKPPNFRSGSRRPAKSNSTKSSTLSGSITSFFPNDTQETDCTNDTQQYTSLQEDAETQRTLIPDQLSFDNIETESFGEKALKHYYDDVNNALKPFVKGKSIAKSISDLNAKMTKSAVMSSIKNEKLSSNMNDRTIRFLEMFDYSNRKGKKKAITFDNILSPTKAVAKIKSMPVISPFYNARTDYLDRLGEIGIEDLYNLNGKSVNTRFIFPPLVDSEDLDSKRERIGFYDVESLATYDPTFEISVESLKLLHEGERENYLQELEEAKKREVETTQLAKIKREELEMEERLRKLQEEATQKFKEFEESVDTITTKVLYEKNEGYPEKNPVVLNSDDCPVTETTHGPFDDCETTDYSSPIPLLESPLEVGPSVYCYEDLGWPDENDKVITEIQLNKNTTNIEDPNEKDVIDFTHSSQESSSQVSISISTKRPSSHLDSNNRTLNPASGQILSKDTALPSKRQRINPTTVHPEVALRSPSVGEIEIIEVPESPIGASRFDSLQRPSESIGVTLSVSINSRTDASLNSPTSSPLFTPSAERTPSNHVLSQHDLNIATNPSKDKNMYKKQKMDFSKFTTKELRDQLKSWGFKSCKSRADMLELLDSCNVYSPISTTKYLKTLTLSSTTNRPNLYRNNPLDSPTPSILNGSATRSFSVYSGSTLENTALENLKKLPSDKKDLKKLSVKDLRKLVDSFGFGAVKTKRQMIELLEGCYTQLTDREQDGRAISSSDIPSQNMNTSDKSSSIAVETDVQLDLKIAQRISETLINNELALPYWNKILTFQPLNVDEFCSFLNQLLSMNLTPKYIRDWCDRHGVTTTQAK